MVFGTTQSNRNPSNHDLASSESNGVKFPQNIQRVVTKKPQPIPLAALSYKCEVLPSPNTLETERKKNKKKTSAHSIYTVVIAENYNIFLHPRM